MTKCFTAASLLLGLAMSAAPVGCGGESGSSSGAGTSGPGGGQGGSGAEGGTGAQGGGGGSAQGGGGSGPECTTADECPGTDDDCQTRTCEGGVCGLDFTAADTPVTRQTPGDCKTIVCDGQGATTTLDDDADILDDNKECTTDTCDAGTPANTPVAAGTPCSQGGGLFCAPDGTCVECVDGKDCMSLVCDQNVCVAPTCMDAVKNGNETDVDCGGPDCSPCADGLVCNGPDDCTSLVCTGNVCQVPTCSDGVDNGNETDVDCGGPDCPGCGPGLGCMMDSDCVGGSCSGSICLETCTDIVKNQDETDVDCGGAICGACADGLACLVGGDCLSGVCKSNVCEAPICGDGVVNGADVCDDFGIVDGDGCSATCTVEAGYTCMGTPSDCDPICGDGLVVGSEPCDDGNANSGDGCAACVVEMGWVCSGQPSVCFEQQIVTVGPGLNASVADNAYNGAMTAPSMTCVDIVVPSQANNTVASLSVQLAMNHTWVGDLVFKLVSPANTVVTLMSRPGTAEPADDGNLGGTGNAANLVVAFPVTFITGAPTSAENMGQGLTSAQDVCSANGICSYAPNNGAAPPGNLTAYAGQASNGTWKFCAGDTATGDTGAISAVTLTILK